MKKIDIGLVGKEPLPIKKGFPKRFKSRKFYNAVCYHIEVDPGEYILFQNILVGPFSCWYTEYFLSSHQFFYCDMDSTGVEFHSMIEGGAMYMMDNSGHWFVESKGAHNILVNPPKVTTTAFTALPVKTFDIHISVEHFMALMDQYPTFKNLLPAIRSGHMGTLFTNKEEGSLQLKFGISQMLENFGKAREALTKNKEQTLIQHINKIIAAYASSNTSELTAIKIKQPEIDKVLHFKNYLEQHYMDSKVIADAQSRYPLPPEKLKKCFKILFNNLPKLYLIKERIKKAKIFMQNNPAAKRQEIAMSVGYLDAGYLNKLFKRLEGHSIEQYRAQLESR